MSQSKHTPCLKGAVGRHTPGPWFAGPLQSMDEYGGPGGVSVGTYDLFEAYGGRPDYAPGLFDDHCEDQIALVSGCNHDAVANALLISVAPELFDLARDAVEILTALIESREEEIGEEDEVARDLLARAKALIAKATPTDTPEVG